MISNDDIVGVLKRNGKMVNGFSITLSFSV